MNLKKKKILNKIFDNNNPLDFRKNSYINNNTINRNTSTLNYFFESSNKNRRKQNTGLFKLGNRVGNSYDQSNSLSRNKSYGSSDCKNIYNLLS